MEKREENGVPVPLVTVIIAVFNDAAHLEATIRSVLDQTYDNLELIIIDGASEDDTLEIIRKYEDTITCWISEADKGIYDAWNKGLRSSNGEWLAFLGAGDTYFRDAVKAYVEFIYGGGNDLPEFVSSRVDIADNRKVFRTVGSEWSWEKFRKYMNVAHVGSLHHHSLFKKYGMFDTDYKISGDYEYLLRPREHLKARFLNRVTATMTTGGASSRSMEAIKETERAKIFTGRRNRFTCRLETILAAIKWQLRTRIWY